MTSVLSKKEENIEMYIEISSYDSTSAESYSESKNNFSFFVKKNHLTHKNRDVGSNFSMKLLEIREFSQLKQFSELCAELS